MIDVKKGVLNKPYCNSYEEMGRIKTNQRAADEGMCGSRMREGKRKRRWTIYKVDTVHSTE